MIFLYLLLAIVGLFVLALLLYFGWSVIHYVPIVERNAFEVPRYQIPTNHNGRGTWREEDISITISGSGAIRGRYIYANKPTKRVVVFCHETAADLNSWQKHLFYMPDAGFDVLTFDFNPAMVINRPGESAMMSYQWPTREELQCLTGTLRWIKTNRPGYEIGLFGISKGAVLAAAGSVMGDVKAVVIEGAFSTYRTLESYMKKWVKIYIPQEALHKKIHYSVFSLLARITVKYASFRKNLSFFSVESFLPLMKTPVFIIHAGQDHYIPVEQAVFIQSRLNGHSEFWLAKKSTHSNTVAAYTQEYEARIKRFFDDTLQPADTPAETITRRK